MKIESAEFARACAHGSDGPTDGLPEVVFAGRSNVGKSSLLNRLVGRNKLARTSSTPGRTRTINYFLVNGRWYFVDLPGFGYAKAGKDERRAWAENIEQYLGEGGERRLLVQLVDGYVGPQAIDRQASDYFAGLRVQRVVVATKIDRLPKGQRARAVEKVRAELGLGAGVEVIAISAETGEGVRELWKRIAEFLAR